jgi:hypothetical protein
MAVRRSRVKSSVEYWRAQGATGVEFHPDGSVARVQFEPAKSRHVPKELTTEEKIAEERKRRNPQRNSLDVAQEILNERSRIKDGNA